MNPRCRILKYPPSTEYPLPCSHRYKRNPRLDRSYGQTSHAGLDQSCFPHLRRGCDIERILSDIHFSWLAAMIDSFLKDPAYLEKVGALLIIACGEIKLANVCTFRAQNFGMNSIV